MTTPAIRTENLERNFGNLVALDHLDLDVSEGSVYALVGPNGAGKTTLIKLLMNLIRATAGTAEIMGIDSRRLSGNHFARIGYVSENQDMPEGMTVESMLAYLRSFYPTWDRDLERRLLRRFELPSRQKLAKLSRGMRMKAAFVSSLAYRPKVVVLDEPFSGLDPVVRDELVETIIDNVSESTFFLSSHDLSEIENVASDIGFLRQGKLLCSEEMLHLANRFREVNLTLENSEPLPSGLPESWLHVQAANRAVSFVHSGYIEGASEREVAQRFPTAREIAFLPMSLRAIFLAIARSARQGAAGSINSSDTKENLA